ncbi:MAG: carbohydrate ABC transporter permease [Defluviitaleaceae bacterium]|nr:carbohydrate ABC transporter permease [Defluviitaleaceae bacterium]
MNNIALNIAKVFIYAVCIVLALLSIMPFAVMFANATRSTPEIRRNAFTVLPGGYLLDNYRHMMGFVYTFVDEDGNRSDVAVPSDVRRYDAAGVAMYDADGNPMFYPLRGYIRMGGRAFNPWLGFRNSLIISLATMILAIYFSSLTAYANVAYDWKFKNILFAFIMFVLMIPVQLNIIGYFQFLHQIANWTNETLPITVSVNSFWPLILPAIASPGIVFFMRQYLLGSLSMEIVESARIDGAGEFRTFNTIVLPLMKPALATQAIFVFVGSWNNLLLPMIILRGDNRTMPVMVQLLQGDIYDTVLGAQYLGLAMTVLPLFIVYFILSKYIISGVALGGMKE